MTTTTDDVEVIQKFRGSGCIIWIGARDKRGYGMIRRDGRTQRVHRYLLKQEQDVPDDMDVHHLCENKPCINLDHLEVVPHLFNIQQAKEMQSWKNRIRRFHETGEWITAGAAASRRHRG